MSVFDFVVRVRLDCTTPATVTTEPSGYAFFSLSEAESVKIAPMGTIPALRTAARYSSIGWPLRYRPAVSFSIASSSARVYSSTSGILMLMAPASSKSGSPNRLSCPSTLLRLSCWMPSIMTPATRSSALRLKPMLSNAPARMRFSTARRLSSLPAMRRQKSSRLRNGPSSSRREISSFMKPRPMLFIATRPKRISFPLTEKSANDSLTSGGRSLMPISRHSAMYSAILVLLSSTDESSAAMYWRG